jgi:hypothetical protein
MTNNANTPTLISSDNFDLVTTFCILDDLIKCFRFTRIGRKPSLSLSEIATIVLIGCVYECGCLKSLHKLLCDKFSSDFKLPCYKNFVCLMNNYSVQLSAIIHFICSLNNQTEGVITFCDSTKIEVCRIYREGKHRTMKLIASKSKSTTGWFYGLRLHILCDQEGNLRQIKFTTATTGEREVLDEFLGKIKNCIVVADAGYVSKDLNQVSAENGNILLTAVRKNMKTLATVFQNKCMNMRSRIESVFGELKERFGLVTSLPRSVSGYLAHYVRCLFGYMFLD